MLLLFNGANYYIHSSEAGGIFFYIWEGHVNRLLLLQLGSWAVDLFPLSVPSLQIWKFIHYLPCRVFWFFFSSKKTKFGHNCRCLRCLVCQGFFSLWPLYFVVPSVSSELEQAGESHCPMEGLVGEVSLVIHYPESSLTCTQWLAQQQFRPLSNQQMGAQSLLLCKAVVRDRVSSLA